MRPSYLEPLESRIAPATLAITPLIVDEGDAGTGNNVHHIQVTLDSAAAQDVTVHYTLVSGTAQLNNQFSPVTGQAADGTLTFLAGSTTAQIDFVTNGNSVVNPDTSFSVHLDNVTGGATLPAADGVVTIWDDDSVVNFTQESLNQQVAEGSVATPGQFQYSATLSAAADHIVTVKFDTSAHGSSYGDATTFGAAADYTATSTTLVFAAGSLTPTSVATVAIKGDTLPGPDEIFNATLSKNSSTAPFGAKLGNVATTSTIVNDDVNDQSDLTVSLVNDTVSTSEGGVASFAVQLSRLSESPVVITYHTSDGASHTATAGSDYVAAVNATKTVDSVLQDSIQVQVQNDTHVEGAETFKLTLDGATVGGAPIVLGAKTTAVATIAADPLPKVVFVQLDPTTHLPLPSSSPSNNGDVTVVESTPSAARTADFLVKLAYLDAQGNVDNNHHFDLTEAVTVDFATFGGTATSSAVATSGDFIAKTGTLTFDVGTTDVTAPKTVSVAINPDTLAESSETFTLKLSNVHGATIGDDTAVGTIVDSNMVLTVRNTSISEGNDGSTTAVFNIIPGRTIPAGYNLVVDYATKDGTAVSTGGPGTTQDFVAKTGQLTFDSTFGRALSVTVNGDRVVEKSETFTLELSNARLVPVGGSGGTSVTLAGADADGKVHGTGTIVNDDGTAISASITAAATQAEGAGATANFTVHLSQMYASPITVNYTLTKTDPITKAVTTSPGHFDIPAYTQDATLPIDYVNDAEAHHDQTLTVTLTSLVSTDKTASLVPLVSAKTAKTTILEDDFYVRIFDKAAAELDSGTSVMAFDVKLVDVNGDVLDAGLDHAVSVSFSTIDGTATSTGTGADFLARSATVVFSPTQTAKTADITIRGDTNVGGDETFNVQLGTPTGGQLFIQRDANNVVTLDGSKATGTITNDDSTTAPTVTLVPLAAGVEADAAHGIAGSPATFQVLLSNASGQPVASEQPVTFQYSTSLVAAAPNSDAASQDDFTAVSAATGTIASGETSTTLSVAVLPDTVNENAEHFGLTVSNIAGASNTGPLTAEGTIAASDQPTISVANASVLEGNSGTTNLTFTVKLSAATNKDVSFYVETLATGGTATSGDDYVPVARQLITIAHDTTEITQNVVINGDTTAGEGNETFIFRVSDVVNATPATLDATGTILNDEASFSITPAVTVHENDEVASFTVTRSGDFKGPADVTFQTIAGTAVSSGAFPDFVGGSSFVHFVDGQTTASFSIALVDNDRHEADETFSVQLTGATNGILGAASASTVTILDNDAVPTATLTSPAAVLERDSGVTNVTFTVTLDHANEADDILLTYSTANLSAIAGQDYVGVADQHLTIEKGLLSKTFNIQVLNDTTFDSLKTETFQVKLSADSTANNPARVQFANNATMLTGTASIIDNDVAPQISIQAASFDEGTNSNFNVVLNHASDKPVAVKYYTVNGTAVAGADFTGRTTTAPGTLTFGPGVTSMSLNTIATNDDALVEGNETFKLQLFTPTNATLNTAASSAIGTIVDSDHAYLSINDVTLMEGDSGTKDAIFTVSLDGDTVAPVTFNYHTANGSAVAGDDYIAKSGSITLGGATGPHSAQIVVKVVGDLVKEAGPETFTVLLTDAKVGSLAKDIGTGTILNDGDSQATISVSSAVGVEGDPISAGGTGDTKMLFTVTASDVLDQDVSFTVKTSDILKAANVARLGTDYLQPKLTSDPTHDLTLTIPKNATGDTTHHSVTFEVTVKADSVFETTEFFNVTLTNISGAQPGHVVGTGTIYDNDLYFTQKLIKWTDVDGDIVSMSVSKGNLGTAGFGFDSTSSLAGTMGGRILQQLNLATQQAGAGFAHGNLAIVSTQQPDASGALVGDGRVNVGYIRANNYDSVPTVLELVGFDLANVTVDGDLSRINIGDLYADPAVGTLSVYSLGVKSALTEQSPNSSQTGQPIVFASQIVAGISNIKVTNDISGIVAVTGGIYGKIGTITVGGALRGTDQADSARILATSAIGKATFHDILGGAGAHSASLTQYDTTASLGSLTVTGDIKAGTGVQSGHVFFPTIGSVNIGGSLTGSATGGGFISASKSLGSVTIGGNFDGGARIYGGGLADGHAIKSVLVKGNVDNAQIKGGYTAQIVDTITTPAAMEFKANADAQIDSVQVDGSVHKFDILAGTDPAAPTSAFNKDDAALFSRIAKVILNGDILPNSETHYISAQSIGTIIVQGASKSGSIPGTELEPGSNFLLKFAI
jgi:hypothetical protein